MKEQFFGITDAATLSAAYLKQPEYERRLRKSFERHFTPEKLALAKVDPESALKLKQMWTIYSHGARRSLEIAVDLTDDVFRELVMDHIQKN